MTLRFRAPVVAGLLLVGGCLAACTPSSTVAAKPGTCLAPLSAVSLSAVSTSAATAPHAAAALESGPALPRTALGCLDGTGDVTLAAVGRPMIVSFWATYCSPCQAEEPVVEAFTKAAGGSVAVVGVDSGDERSKALSFVSSFGLTFPMVSDPTTGLLKSVAPPELPRLLFVTPGGRIAFSYASNQLTPASLRALTAKYLGVSVR